MALRPDNMAANRSASHGRGGAGNIIARSEDSTTTPVNLETPTIKQPLYTTGRGGSGNMANNDPANPAAARKAQDVDSPAHHNKEPSGTFHWGRGGEGNMMTVGDGDGAKSKERTQSKSGERRPSLGNLVDKGKEFLGLNKRKESAARTNEVAIE